MARGKTGWRGGVKGPALVVVALSVLAMALTVPVAHLLEPWEAGTADLLLRWRYHLTPKARRHTGRHVVLLAIDTNTQDALGRFGAGQWLTRTPFLNQLRFLETYSRPSVVAYDIIFQEGEAASGRVEAGLSAGELERISVELGRVADDVSDVISLKALRGLTRFSALQGDVFLAHRLASVVERDRFPTVIGYNLRGGDVDPQAVAIPRWSREDVVGPGEGGDEEDGTRVPYLRDVAIPAESMHFADPASERDYGFSPNANLPSRRLLDYSFLGFLNGRPEEDSTMRRLPLVLGFEFDNPVTGELERAFVPSFALMACLLHLGVEFPLEPGVVDVYWGKELVIRSPEHGDYHVPIDEQGKMYLKFTGTIDDYDAISFAEVAPDPETTSEEARDLLAARYTKAINGRIAMVGITATGVDVGACPLVAATPLVLVHMTAVSNILDRSFLTPLSGADRSALLVVLLILFTLVCLFEGSSRLGPAALAFALLYIALVYTCVHNDWTILPVVAPCLYLGVCSFSVLSFRFVTEERERRKIRGMFSTMVSGTVLSYLEENPESFSLRGHDVDATVFFSDIASFTAISEPLPPERLIALLNSYLTPVTDCIMASGGYLDKYVGDSVMAVWGAPYADTHHAVKACLCALEQQRIIAGLNAGIRSEYGVTLGVRMGLNSGPVTAGNMGSEKKFQYTVVGDVVNMAARLEPANKEFGTNIIIGDATYRAAEDRVEVRPLGRIMAEGKGIAAPIYELLGEKGTVSPDVLAVAGLYARALEAFYDRQWSACMALTDSILASVEDGPARSLRERALRYDTGRLGESEGSEIFHTGKK